MTILTGLETQTSLFAGSLSAKTAPVKEGSEPDVSQAAKIPTQGDRITLSLEARALSAAEKDSSTESSSSDGDQLVKTLTERAQKLREEIQELQQDDSLSEDAKTQKVQAKEAELMQILDQLARAEQSTMAASGYNAYGGTRANGFASSLTGG